MKADRYKTLVEEFLSGKVTADEFAMRFNAYFLNEPGGMSRSLFDILQNLFEDIMAYSPMWLLEEESITKITEPTLRKEASVAHAQLIDYLEAQ